MPQINHFNYPYGANGLNRLKNFTFGNDYSIFNSISDSWLQSNPREAAVKSRICMIFRVRNIELAFDIYECTVSNLLLCANAPFE